MEFKFNRSFVVMGQLAQDTARTPPSKDDEPFEYVDQGLTILGRSCDAYNQRMRQEFLIQRQFVASEIREVDTRMDGRFVEFEKKMDGRFEEVDRRFEEVNRRFEVVDGRFEELEKKMDRRFQEVDRRFDQQEGAIRDLTVQVENAAAVTRNGRLRRLHQPINLIKLLKPTDDPNKFVWTSHPQVPKHMKNTYILGQQAKGVFDPSWEKKSNQQSTYLTAGSFFLERFQNPLALAPFILLVSLHSYGVYFFTLS